MIHYTLNTGHSRHSPRSEVGDGVIQQMTPLLTPGEYHLKRFGGAFSDWRLVVPTCPAGYVATLYHGKAPVLTMGVAVLPGDAEAVWPGLESLYLNVTELPGMRAADFKAPRQPETLPWLAVVLVVPTLLPDWCGDFEKCLAHTWIERGKK